MDFEEISRLADEGEQVDQLYALFGEEKKIERYLRSSDRILDIGAGAGTYSLYFARKGYSVSTLEVAAANAQKFCENRCEVAADGASELMQAKINALNEVDFQLCIRYHAYICEKKEFIGMTNHLLFVCENDQERSRVL